MNQKLNLIFLIIGAVLVIITLAFNIQGYGIILLLLGSGFISYAWVNHKKKDSSPGKKLLLIIPLALIITFTLWFIWWGISSGFKM